MYRKKVHLVISKKHYGGGIYGSYISKLSGVRTKILIETNSDNKFVKLLQFIKNLYLFSINHKDTIVIRNLDGCFFMKKSQKNIVVFHHHHPVESNKLIGLYQKFIYWNFFKKISTFDKVVVVSRYWQKHFEKLGYHNTELIYNPFELKAYRQHTKNELNIFKKKYNLSFDKPIVYIGNPQIEKGADIVYEALKDMDIEMVTTGIKHIELPVKHLELSFNDYIILLEVSSLSILMSQVEEGWNRVALESILCKTPVIGSGKGGMKELLLKARQYICNDIMLLKGMVAHILKKPIVSEKSLKYANSFGVDRFNQQWEKLLDDI